MKVAINSIAAGPHGTVDADAVVEVPDAYGKHLIDAGFARAAKADDKVTAKWPHGTDVPKPDKVAKSEGETK